MFLSWPARYRVITFTELTNIRREARLCRESDEMNFGPVEFEVPVRQLSSGGVE